MKKVNFRDHRPLTDEYNYSIHKCFSKQSISQESSTKSDTTKSVTMDRYSWQHSKCTSLWAFTTAQMN